MIECIYYPQKARKKQKHSDLKIKKYTQFQSQVKTTTNVSKYMNMECGYQYEDTRYCITCYDVWRVWYGGCPCQEVDDMMGLFVHCLDIVDCVDM